MRTGDTQTALCVTFCDVLIFPARRPAIARASFGPKNNANLPTSAFSGRTLCSECHRYGRAALCCGQSPDRTTRPPLLRPSLLTEPLALRCCVLVSDRAARLDRKVSQHAARRSPGILRPAVKPVRGQETFAQQAAVHTSFTDQLSS